MPTLSDTIKNGPQFTILGDTNHNDESLQAFFESPAFFRQLREAGVRHLFLETDRQFQESVQQSQFEYRKQNLKTETDVAVLVESEIAQSKVAISNFYKENTGIEELLRKHRLKNAYATLYGIDLNYYDFNSDDKMKLGLELDPRARDDAFRCYTSPYDKIDPRSFFGRLFGAPLDEYMKSYRLMAELRERVSRDDLFGAYILDKAGSDKSVVIIGAGHLDNPKGLDEFLGEKAQTVYVYANHEKYTASVTDTLKGAQIFGDDRRQRADADYFDVARGEMFKPTAQERVRFQSAKGEWPGPVCPAK